MAIIPTARFCRGRLVTACRLQSRCVCIQCRRGIHCCRLGRTGCCSTGTRPTRAPKKIGCARSGRAGIIRLHLFRRFSQHSLEVVVNHCATIKVWHTSFPVGIWCFIVRGANLVPIFIKLFTHVTDKREPVSARRSGQPLLQRRCTAGSALARAMAERYASLSLEDLVVKETLGTGSFGRVRLVQHKDGRHFALKMLKKTEIIYLKQVCGLSLGASFCLRRISSASRASARLRSMRSLWVRGRP